MSASRAKTKNPDIPVQKDWWDKLDIVGKAAIPIVVALSVYLWNADRTERDTSAQMITIAISILNAPPDHSAPNALRNWAIAVLQSPESPPRLPDDAAVALSKEALPTWMPSEMVMEKLLRLKLDKLPPSPPDNP